MFVWNIIEHFIKNIYKLFFGYRKTFVWDIKTLLFKLMQHFCFRYFAKLFFWDITKLFLKYCKVFVLDISQNYCLGYYKTFVWNIAKFFVLDISQNFCLWYRWKFCLKYSRMFVWIELEKRNIEQIIIKKITCKKFKWSITISGLYPISIFPPPWYFQNLVSMLCVKYFGSRV